MALLNRIWMMSKYGICWLHHCTYRREKKVPSDHELITPSQKTQCQVHLISEKVLEKLPQCSHTRERNTFRQRRRFFRTSTSSRKRYTSFRFSDPEEASKLVLEEQRDHLLAEAKSEILKQECKVDTLNTGIREFQKTSFIPIVWKCTA